MQITRRPYTNNLNQKTNFGAKLKIAPEILEQIPEKSEIKSLKESLKSIGGNDVSHIISYNKAGTKILIETKYTVPDYSNVCKSNVTDPFDLVKAAGHNIGVILGERFFNKPTGQRTNIL